MKIAHLILTHKNPAQTERLVYALNHPDAHCFIHLDGKSNISEYQHLEGLENVTFIKNRAKVYWAGYGTIQATINGFEEIIGKGYDYLNVISAQDFPLKSAEEIHQFFVENNGREFITSESIDNEWKDAAPRVRKYHLINWRIPGKHRLEPIVNALLPKRKYPLDHKIVGRSNWFSLTEKAAIYLLDFFRKNPAIPRYYWYCWGADEFMWATTLYNSPFQQEIRDSLIYVDWSSTDSPGHPKILRSDDFDKMIASGKLFARKIDASRDSGIIDLLEKHIGVRH